MRLYNFLLFLVCHHLWFDVVVKCDASLSKEEEFEIERQLKLLNKPSMKTFVNKYGNIYDCIEFYKQPAFDHPLLKNHTFDYQIHLSDVNNETNSSLSSKAVNEKSEPEICPIGTVPIQRISKDDLIRERCALKARRMEEIENGSRNVLVRAGIKVPDDKFGGAESCLSVHKLRISGPQFASTRIRLQSGSEAIEAGWRVDPSLYGDAETHFFIRTDASQTHCFNTRCPGFVQTNFKWNLEGFINPLSRPGGPIYDICVRIARDNSNGNWKLRVGNLDVGYWPSSIFGTEGITDRYIEWGSEAYAPKGTAFPPLGSGNKPTGAIVFDAYLAIMRIVDKSSGQTIDAPDNLVIESQLPDLYEIDDRGKNKQGRIVEYGGPGGLKD